MFLIAVLQTGWIKNISFSFVHFLCTGLIQNVPLPEFAPSLLLSNVIFSCTGKIIAVDCCIRVDPKYLTSWSPFLTHGVKIEHITSEFQLSYTQDVSRTHCFPLSFFNPQVTSEHIISWYSFLQTTWIHITSNFSFLIHRKHPERITSLCFCLTDRVCNRLYECVHVYKELEMQSVHFWPNAVNA